KQALDAADKAILLTRARFLVLSSMDLKFRIYKRLGWGAETREVAAYLLDQGYINAETSDLLSEMARADGRSGKISLALAEYRRAIAEAADPGATARLQSERDRLIDGLTSLPALREAAEAEKDFAVQAHLYLHLGRVAVRKGFSGMGAYALEKAARSGTTPGEEAALHLSRLETIHAIRPKIVGLVPLSGKHADIGFAILSGAEVALRQFQTLGEGFLSPVLLWMDTGGLPERARVLFQIASNDRSVIGFIGPLTGEEGHSISVLFDAKSSPVLYLGQKKIPEKPFLYSFGLTPQQEARAVLAHLAREGKDDLLLFYPENGYGQGFAEAVISAAAGTGVRVTRSVSYSPDLTDFTDVIRKAVGSGSFSRVSLKREKGTAVKLPQDAILIADRWERVFLLASQLRFYNVYLPLAGFSGWNDPELIHKAGDAARGAVFSADYAAAIPGPLEEKFRKEYQEGMDLLPSRFAAMGYDAALLFAESARLPPEGNHRPPGESSRERIARLKTFRGVTGTFQFGPFGEVRRKVSLLSVDLGNFVPVPEP
ncbi:MAG TPA: penicillin-binding protein activator, partial [Candidatus Deferrimicrobiaceae bacterium]|nr:penicillin-binding protein activator [Candidatus Deferrimicrobiaceae bacterium]